MKIVVACVEAVDANEEAVREEMAKLDLMELKRNHVVLPEDEAALHDKDIADAINKEVADAIDRDTAGANDKDLAGANDRDAKDRDIANANDRDVGGAAVVEGEGVEPAVDSEKDPAGDVGDEKGVAGDDVDDVKAGGGGEVVNGKLMQSLDRV